MYIIIIKIIYDLRFTAASSSSDFDFFFTAAVFFGPQRTDAVRLHMTDHTTTTANKL